MTTGTHRQSSIRLQRTHYLSLGIALAMSILALAAIAYDPQVVANLKRSRDALLTQRAELKTEEGKIDSQITELQRQRERVEAYLSDTDRALRDVETALQVSSQ